MRKLILAVAIVGLASCGSAKKNREAADKFTVENIENFNITDVEKHYPDANAHEGHSMFDEGTVERPYTVLYPETADELHITWKDEDRKEIHDLRFSKEGRWKSETGIKIGTSYEELNRLNEKEISFYGFGWDYSGAVVWNDGKLEGTKLRVFLEPEQEPDSRYYGDTILDLTEEEIGKLDLKVRNIIYRN